MTISELSFLIELLLKHKLPAATKELVAQRIKDVEENLSNLSSARSISSRPVNVSSIHGGAVQSASTTAAIERHAIITEAAGSITVAQTPAAAAALEARTQAITDSLSGKIDKQRGSPRKF